MRIGTETNSLVNHLYSREVIGAPEPVIGMGATMLGWTDRSPGTVIAWDGKIVTIQADDYELIDGSCQSESQEYRYTPRAGNSVAYFRREKDGRWQGVYRTHKGRWAKTIGGLILGKRERYYDPTF